MLKLLNKYKKRIIIFSFGYIYILMVLLAPSGYYALTPGEISSTKDIYNIDDTVFSNDINTTSVYSWHEISVFQKWIASYQSDIVIGEQQETKSDDSLKSKISNQSSHDNAVITAYELARMDDEKISIEYALKGLIVYSFFDNNELMIGDVITKINNLEITTNNYENYLSALNLYNENAPEKLLNGNYNATILRDDELMTISIPKETTIIFYPKYEILSTNPTYQGYNPENVGGPSGGMIQTLAIYSALRKIDVSEKIAGTGTMVTNNAKAVGEIGGLQQKFITVRRAKVMYFLIPSSQYDLIATEAVKYQNEITVVKVETIFDAISFIRGIKK
ncbi:MAG: S16 family serine protease [Acholeplasma sp.]|nr:S16 family serine protease [Acholeplasma sp.]